MLLSSARNLVLSPCSRRSTRSFASLMDILEQVKNGTLAPTEARDLLLDDSPPRAKKPGGNNNNNTQTLEQFANLDHTRSIVAGFPEAVFAEGKTPEQVRRILESLAQNRRAHSMSPILATRVSKEMYSQLEPSSFQHGTMAYHETARIVEIQHDAKRTERPSYPRVVVATAGTTDIPVAEEAAITLEATQICSIERVYDVGVAGLHRILRALPILREASCVIVVAGMDGALPSVVGGLVRAPTIAVPTSIGYGAAFGGVSPLLTMLNSCSPGVGVVNIDNGFGAAALAYKFVSMQTAGPPASL